MNLSNHIADKVLIASFLQTAAATPQVPLEEWQVIAIAIGAGCVGGIAESLRSLDLGWHEILLRLIACSMFSLFAVGVILHMWLNIHLTMLPVSVVSCGVGLFAWPMAEKTREATPEFVKKWLSRLFGVKGK